MESLDFWRLCDEVTVIQAVLLVIGEDPAKLQSEVESRVHRDRPVGYDAAKAAITHAINSNRLPATIRRLSWERGWEEDPGPDEKFDRDADNRGIIYKADPDWNLTTVAVEDLKGWLRSRGFTTGFFFPEDDLAGPDYLNRGDAGFSPKLAAAICAWGAVRGDSSATKGKTVKQALLIWLRKNADRFGLTKEDGLPNEQGIEEIAKISNWDMKGGAPKTPGE